MESWTSTKENHGVFRGFRGLLSSPLVYEGFQTLIGAPWFRRAYVSHLIKPKAGERVLDIGCGTGAYYNLMRPFQISYLGIDGNKDYINYAKRRHAGDPAAEFRCQLLDRISSSGLSKFDIILAMGFMHHLADEEVLSLLSLAKTLLNPNGRLITMDPCRFEDSGFFEKWMCNNDRGSFVRTSQDYENLVGQVFPNFSLHKRKDNPILPIRAALFDCRS